jgi:spore maturation protein CgeB
MNKWWPRWTTDMGLQVVGMPNAADTTKYNYSGHPNTSLVCDLGWVGGYWGYKAINMDRYLVPVMRKHKSIWFGWSGPKDLWKGQADQNKVTQLYHSAKVCPVVVEPHTTKYGIDMPERIFKAAACGALDVADPCTGINRFFSKDSLVLASTPKEYEALCDYWVAMDFTARKRQAQKLQREVLSKHTYLHRAQKFLSEFGYKEEAAAYDGLIKELVDNMPQSI